MKDMNKFLFILLFFGFACANARIDDYLKKIEDKNTHFQIPSIDFIYLINLDQRKEKLDKCLKQLHQFNIDPYRFSAIYGWELSPQTINDIGYKYAPGMIQRGQLGFEFPLNGSKPKKILLNDQAYGKVLFQNNITKGALGCFLSHLSVLKDAYEAGYSIIWVIEDDILIKENPHQLTTYIEKLNQLVGDENWDILYTDNCSCKFKENELPLLVSQPWRPDRQTSFTHLCKKISEDFVQIEYRLRTHSMIIKRSGIKIILEFFLDKGHFWPL
jgi:GR25 family glycosyltransferase involved in LPS biosynthesis